MVLKFIKMNECLKILEITHFQRTVHTYLSNDEILGGLHTRHCGRQSVAFVLQNKFKVCFHPHFAFKNITETKCVQDLRAENQTQTFNSNNFISKELAIYGASYSLCFTSNRRPQCRSYNSPLHKMQ